MKAILRLPEPLQSATLPGTHTTGGGACLVPPTAVQRALQGQTSHVTARAQRTGDRAKPTPPRLRLTATDVLGPGYAWQPPATKFLNCLRLALIVVASGALYFAVITEDAHAQASTNFIIGTGKDGALVVESNATVTINTNVTSVAGANPAGTNVLNVSSTNGFEAYDLVLIIAMRDPNTNFNENITGMYEFQRIRGMTSNSVVFFQPLSNSYSIYQPGVQIQAINVPEYTSVTVNGTLTAPPWNGNTGGVLAILCQSNLMIGSEGTVTVAGLGYRGGSGGPPGCGTQAFQGEGTAGVGVESTQPNPQGGGGSSFENGSSGGGGGYGSSGSDGTQGGFNDVCNQYGTGGAGAAAFGFPDLRTLYLGGGGGGCGGWKGQSCSIASPGGGSGGGIIFAAAAIISGTGVMSASGAPGGDGGNGCNPHTEGAGGGAGGSIRLIGQIVSPVSNLALGGAGGNQGYGAPGGAGGLGRIRLDLLPGSLTNSSPSAFTTNIVNPPFFGTLLDYATNGLGPPFILSQTQSEIALPGSDVTFQLTVSQAAQPVFCQWQFNGANLVGQTNPTLVLLNVQGNNDGTYEMVAWNHLGTNTSVPVSLSVQYTNSFYYDQNNRLVGVEYGYGISIAYVYDGNGNPARQVYLDRSYESNGLPVLWRFLNGLSPTNNSGTNALYGDSDGNGWSNYEKWLAGLNPLDPNSLPDIFGLPGTNLAAMSLPFAPSNFVVGVGSLDNYGGPTIVVGADGDPGTNANSLLILSETFSGWSTQQVNIGPFGVTSIAIGQPANRASPAIYVGLRQTGGTGEVAEITSAGGNWATNPIAYSTNGAAFVLGVRPTNDVLVSLATTNAADRALSRLFFSTNGWNLALFDTNTSHRGLGRTILTGAYSPGSLRLLDNNGGIQIASGVATNSLGLLLSEPATTSTLTWRGIDLDSGVPRGSQSNAVSVFYALVDDKNTNGIIDAGDDFVLAEYLLSGTNVVGTNILREPVTASPAAQGYGLASVNYLNTTNEVLFTAEPDGQIYSWIATDSSSPLQRQRFSSQHAGTAWHALARVPTLEPGQGLVGLSVNPTNPSLCNVVFWPPQTTLWTPASVPQSAPVATVLTQAITGVSILPVGVRLSDAQGDASIPFLQYQFPGSTNWANGIIVEVDGLPYHYDFSDRVAALPSGSDHTLSWDASAIFDLLSPGTETNVLLQARARDVSLTGPWSASVPYTLVRPATPVAFRAVMREPDGSILISGSGPANVGYNLLTTTNLALPLSSWTVLVTNVFNVNGNFSFNDPSAGSNNARFYLITVAYQSAAPAGWAPASLSGLSAGVTSANGTQNASTISFGTGTFSRTMLPGTNEDDNVVGNYTYARQSANTGLLTVTSIAPPDKANHTTVMALTFTNGQNAVFNSTNSDGTFDAGGIVFAPVPGLAPPSLTATLDAVDYAGSSSTFAFSNGTLSYTASGTAAAGSYTYTQYSPVGGLLLIKFTSPASAAGTVDYFVTTWSTATTGSWAVEIFPPGSGASQIDYGTFTLP